MEFESRNADSIKSLYFHVYNMKGKTMLELFIS